MGSERAGDITEVNVELTGDPELRQSIGTLTVYFEGLGEGEDGTLDIGLSIPDRFGCSTLYNFEQSDWQRILEAVDSAALRYFTGVAR